VTGIEGKVIDITGRAVVSVKPAMDLTESGAELALIRSGEQPKILR
jgi:hypothetical protein